MQTKIASEILENSNVATKTELNTKANTSELSKYLPLTGGTLTGNLTIDHNNPRIVLKNANFEKGNIPASNVDTYITISDKNNSIMGQLINSTTTSGNAMFFIRAFQNSATTNSYANFSLVQTSTGDSYATCPTPSTSAPNSVIYNKEALKRDFLEKSRADIDTTIGNPINITRTDTTEDFFNVGKDYIQTHIFFRDSKYNIGGAVINTVHQDGSIGSSINSRRYMTGQSTFPSSSVIAGITEEDVPYATAPAPRGLYNTDIVTYKSMVDYAPKKLTANATFHVNANTGSDTADLFNGRGLSEDKPFKSLQACLMHICENCIPMRNWVIVMLHSDVTTPGTTVSFVGNGIIIKGDDSVRTITTSGAGFYIEAGCLILEDNLKFVFGSNVGFLVRGGNGHATAALQIKSDVEFSGECNTTVLSAQSNGVCFINGNITGNVVGKRYACNNGGKILTYGKGAEVIPGTIAGTCDSSSTYA